MGANLTGTSALFSLLPGRSTPSIAVQTWLPSRLGGLPATGSYSSRVTPGDGGSVALPVELGSRAGDTLGTNGEAQVQDSFEAVVYSSRFFRAAFSGTLGLPDTAAKQGGAADEPGTPQVDQLEFSFVRELRDEELVRFAQRTQTVAAGLNDSTRSTYLEASRRVAARFQFSMKISGAALDGFAAASEGAQGNVNTVDSLVELVNRLSEKSDEFFNELFALLGDFFSGSTNSGDFAASMNQFFQDLFAGFFGVDASGTDMTAQAANVQLEFTFSIEVSAETVVVQQQQVQQGDPLVLDLDDDGIELTNYRNGARFDLLGAGQSVNTAFVTGGDAFLALDRNNDGLINNGTELFGEQNGAANGFEELRKLDSNGDGMIDALDDGFARLRLFRDNGNGITEQGELLSLAEAGVAAIDLNYTNTQERTAGGNSIAQTAAFRRANGAYGRAADVLLNYTV